MYPSLSDGKLADLQDFLLLHSLPPPTHHNSLADEIIRGSRPAQLPVVRVAPSGFLKYWYLIPLER